MHSDDFFGSERSGGDVSDRQGGSIRGEDTMFGNVLLHFLDDLVLDVDVLEDGLDDHVGGVEPLVADGARRVAGDRVRLELRQLLSFDWGDGKVGVTSVIQTTETSVRPRETSLNHLLRLAGLIKLSFTTHIIRILAQYSPAPLRPPSI